MKSEIFYLVCVTALTAVLWIPYVLDRIRTGGVADAVGYPTHPRPQSPWAMRLKAAHASAIENLAVFAPLVLVASVLGVSNSATLLAAPLYFWARVVHALAYTFAVPWVRTLAFVAGFVAQMIFVWQVIAH